MLKLLSSPGRTGGLFPRLKAPKRNRRMGTPSGGVVVYIRICIIRTRRFLPTKDLFVHWTSPDMVTVYHAYMVSTLYLCIGLYRSFCEFCRIQIN